MKLMRVMTSFLRSFTGAFLDVMSEILVRQNDTFLIYGSVIDLFLTNDNRNFSFVGNINANDDTNQDKCGR